MAVGTSIPFGWKECKLEDFLVPTLRKVEKPLNGYRRLGIRSHGKGTFITDVEDPEDVAMTHLFKVASGDLIVNITFAWEGAIALVKASDEGALVSHRFPTYTFKEDTVISDFFKYIIVSKRFVHALGNISPGGAGRNRVMSKRDFLKLTIPLPPLPEQRKIAEILGTWDEAIRLTADLIAAKQQRKKGLMERLLTGEVRFRKSDPIIEPANAPQPVYELASIGKFPSDWNLGKLGDFATVKARIGWRGLSSSEYTSEGPYLIAGRHIIGSRISWEACDHISEFRYNESKEIALEEGDVIISKDGTIGRVGFVENMPGLATINGTMMLIRPDPRYFNQRFVYYYLQGDYFQRVISEKISGSSIPHIFQRDMVNLWIPIPPKEEQTKASDFLKLCDDELDLLQQKLAALQQQKKGLMQRLLTGQVRVKV